MAVKKGDHVRKVEGYPFPGEVVSVFKTAAGNTRVVVECTAPAVRGCLHIFNPLQLRVVAKTAVKRRVTNTGEDDGTVSGHKKRVARANGFGRTGGD
jgi:hypothetical protein